MIMRASELTSMRDLSEFPCLQRICMPWLTVPYTQRCALPVLDTAAPGSLDASMHTFFGDEWSGKTNKGECLYRQVQPRRRRKKGLAPPPITPQPRTVPAPDSPFWELPPPNNHTSAEVIDIPIDDALGRLTI